MLSQDVLRRLSDLNRQTLPPAPDRRPPPSCLPPAATRESMAALPAGRELATPFGSHWLSEQRVESLWPDYSRRVDQWQQRRDQAATEPARHQELEALAQWLPRSTALLDLETCGLAGAMIFLVGLVHEQEGQMVLSQLLARNYAEEKPMLATLWRLIAGRHVLVTFNGKSFDWPLVHDRSTLHHLGFHVRSQWAGPPNGEWLGPVNVLNREDPRPDPLHCDVLHHARRRWRSRLPNCKLQTLEQYICGRRRSGDIPGHAIPRAYHDYVRTGDAWQVRSILHHNALDLITLLQLSMILGSPPN